VAADGAGIRRNDLVATITEVKETRAVTDPFENLFRVLVESHYEAPGNMAARLKALPKAGSMPPPWATWAAFGLIEYAAKAAQTVSAIAARSDVDRGRRSDDAMTVKGSSNGNLCFWINDGDDAEASIKLSGRRSASGRKDEERSSPLLVPVSEFTEGVWARRWTCAAERRIVELHPGCRSLPSTLDELINAGLLRRLDGAQLSLDDRLKRYAAPIRTFLDAWELAEDRTWLAGLLGDWPAAEEAARGPDDRAVVELTSQRAKICRRLRKNQLLQRLEETKPDLSLLHAIKYLAVPVTRRLLVRAIEGPPDCQHVALDWIGPRVAWGDVVLKLFRRLLAGPDPDPDLLARCATNLAGRPAFLTSAIRDLVVRGWLGEAAVLAIEGGHVRAEMVLRRALRSTSARDRLTAVAVLNLIDEWWSRNRLIEVLEQSDDWEATAECRAALRGSRDPEGWLTAEQWESRHAEARDVVRRAAPTGNGPIGEVGAALAAEMGRIRHRIAKNQEFMSVGFHCTLFRLNPSAADLGFVGASAPGGARSGG
jgi:hypothetical protein